MYRLKSCLLYTSFHLPHSSSCPSKSGTTNAAGHVFIATATDDEGHELICAYFGNVSKESTFASIRSLFDYAFKSYKKGKITLTPSNYDVRSSKKYGDVYSEYSSLHCYPVQKDGLFDPNKAITRSQLGTMLGAIDSLKDKDVYKRQQLWRNWHTR